MAVAVFLAYVARLPDEFRIERSARIQASAGSVFARIDDLREFNTWNPFAAADPAMQIAYASPSRGAGAAYEWDSTGRGGKGRMIIVESQAPAQVVLRLEFVKPFAQTNTVVFSTAQEGPATNITWAMTGRRPFMHKLFGTIFSMDKMVGGEFAKGLAELKRQVET